MTILSSSLISSLKSTIGSVVKDASLTTRITYKMTGATVSTWDPTTGVIPDMYTTSEVSAFKGTYSLDEVNKSRGLIEYGDVKFVLMASDVTGILSVDDMVVASATSYQSATTYQVKSISRDPLSFCYFIQGRSV
jgi:hypothetical protein